MLCYTPTPDPHLVSDNGRELRLAPQIVEPNPTGPTMYSQIPRRHSACYIDLSTRDSCITRMTEAISVRLPEDIATRLGDLAKSLERPKTYIVTKALREYLDEYEDYLVALHRLKDKNDRVVSEKELVKVGR